MFLRIYDHDRGGCESLVRGKAVLESVGNVRIHVELINTKQNFFCQYQTLLC